MFQKKPVLFYDIYKSYNNANDTIYFENYFSDINLLIDKIKFLQIIALLSIMN